MASLSDIPFLSGYMQQGQLNRQNEFGELRQAAGVQSLMANMRAQRQAEQERAEMEKIKPLIAQAGGDPTMAIKALLSTGNPRAIELASKLKGMMPKAPESYTLSPGAQRRGPDNQLLAEAPISPKNERVSNLRQLFKEMGELPKGPEGDEQRAIYKDRIRKESRNAPPQSQVNVYSGSLTPGVNAQGDAVFVQPSGREGTPPRMVEGVFPPERADQRKAKQVEREGELTSQNVRNRISRMGQIIQGGAVAGGVVGPLGVASKMAETVMGAAKPDSPTPAIDYENEQALLLSDVRKLVEKDPNLSKDERDRLYQTLGGGFWQTPGSALRAMKNIVDYVESKKVSGPSRAAQRERRAPEIGTVKDGYVFNGGDPSNPQSWKKQ